MSNAKKCDRCGAFYESYYPGISIEKKSGLKTKTTDLCPVCQDALESWLYLKPGTMGEYINMSLYDIPLEEMGLSTKLWNILVRGLYELDPEKYADRNEIKVKDLCGLKIEDVQKLRYMETKSWRELVSALSKEAADGKSEEEQSSRDDNI